MTSSRFAVCLLIAFAACSLCAVDAAAEPGDFWYGMWNVFPTGIWGDSIYAKLHNQFKMNWFIGPIYNQAHLDTISSYGFRVVHNPEKPLQQNLIFRFTRANYLGYEAEGDTIGYLMGPLETTPCRECIFSSGGIRVSDMAASGGSAWLFRPDSDAVGSEVWADHRLFRDRKPGEYPSIVLRFRLRTRQSASQQPLAEVGVREWQHGEEIATQTLLVSDHDTPGYKNYNVGVGTIDPWDSDIFVRYLGAESLWVDIIADGDDDGYVLKDGDVDDSIKTFAEEQSYNHSSTIVAFWMDEEWYHSANVYTHKRVDALIKAQVPGRHGFTQNHDLKFVSPGVYAGRVAASAREEEETHFPSLSYPFRGYNPTAKPFLPEPGTVVQRASIPYPPDPVSYDPDTAILVQEQFDIDGQWLRFNKRFAQSIGAKFVPFVQSYFAKKRDNPISCYDDTTWFFDYRYASSAEAKTHAGLALANGVNGLLYYKYTGAAYGDTIQRDCDPSPIFFYNKEDGGLAQSPAQQEALAEFIGPFVDSLGHYFADAGVWKGGGRIDLWNDSTGLELLFDSTARSLTYTGGGEEAFVEAGVFESGSTQYFMLVNRRAYDTIPQDVLVWLNPAQDTSLYYIIDQYSKDTTLAGGMGAVYGQLVPFRASINPGEFKFFKIVSAGISSVTGSNTPQTWVGRIPMSGNVQIDTSRTLTVLGPAEIQVNGGGGYTITAYGDMTVKGTTEYPVTFRHNSANPYRYAWNGLKHIGPGTLNWEYVHLQHAYKGLWLTDQSASVEPSINHCKFSENQLAGIWVETDTLSTVQVKNSAFLDNSYYGVQVYKGVASVDTCSFMGDMLNGVRVEGTTSRSGGVHVRGCLFDSLQTNNAAAVYFQTVANDQIDPVWGLPALEGNLFGSQWGQPTTQSAIYVNNCNDMLVFKRNEIRSNGTGSYLSYGILNFSSPTRLRGDLSQEEERSTVTSTIYGLYSACASSGDYDQPHVRDCSFAANYYNVYLPNYGKVDLGTKASDPGNNAFHGYMDSCGCGIGVGDLINLKNASSTQVKAIGNFWGDSLCSCWPYIVGNVDFSSWLELNPYGVYSLPKTVSPAVSDPTHSVRNYEFSTLCYPNPSNSSIAISVGLDLEGLVQIVVYNVLGQKVRSLWNGTLSTGDHLFTWDGRDDRGREVSSGVYFYRVTVGNRQLTKKLALVK